MPKTSVPCCNRQQHSLTLFFKELLIPDATDLGGISFALGFHIVRSDGGAHAKASNCLSQNIFQILVNFWTFSIVIAMWKASDAEKDVALKGI